MNDGKVVPFDIKKKYKNYKDLTSEDYHEVGGVIAPLFDSIYVDRYDNTIGKTKSGKEVLIPKK